MKTFVLNGWAAGEAAWSLCTFRRDRVFSYVEQLDGAPEAAMCETDCAVLVGWSMGGSGALRLALQFPGKVKGLVLVATTARMMRDDGWAGMTPRRLAALELGLKLTKGEGFGGVAQDRPNPYMMDSDANLARGLDYLRATDLRHPLRELAASGRARFPVFIFQSEHDGIVRPENARFLASVFPGSRVEMIAGAEHALPVAIPAMIDAAVAEAHSLQTPRHHAKA